MREDEFWALAPCELERRIDSFKRRDEWAKRTTAYEITRLICALGMFRTPPDPQMVFNDALSWLLGKERPVDEGLLEIYEESKAEAAEAARLRGLNGGEPR